MDTKSYAIINTSSPFELLNGKESLDAALLIASFECEVALFFVGDGVYQTQTNQSPELVGNKDYLATFKALEFYDIDKIYICQDSLEERGLVAEFNLNGAQLLSGDAIANKLKQYDINLRF